MEQNLSNASITELKAMAYDAIAGIEMLKTNLVAINQELENRRTQSVSNPNTENRSGGSD